MTKKMLTRYRRWVHEQRKNKNLKTTRSFIIEEAEFQMAAAETIHGFQKVNVSRQNKKKARKAQNVRSVNTITEYDNVTLSKRKI